MARNKDKLTKIAELYELMKDHPEMCGDDTHKAVAAIIKTKHGKKVKITKEIVQEIVNLDRARRKVLEKHPELDRRNKTAKGGELEETDRQFHRDN